MSIDLVADSDVLAVIETQINSGNPLHAKLLKLNSYGKGGFFKAHRE